MWTAGLPSRLFLSQISRFRLIFLALRLGKFCLAYLYYLAYFGFFLKNGVKNHIFVFFQSNIALLVLMIDSILTQF
jgi:hypothetical protein